MTTPTLSMEQQSKLKKFMEAGITILEEVDYKKESLRELSKDLAEQLQVKPAELNKALRTKYKQSLESDRERFEIVEDLVSMCD